jgi:DNA-directed RNA polymerase specialized sigma24 family protein
MPFLILAAKALGEPVTRIQSPPLLSLPVDTPSAGEDGLEELFRKYSSMVFRICLRYTKNREDAEDMVSEVFMKVSRGMEDYRGDAKPMVWIYPGLR